MYAPRYLWSLGFSSVREAAKLHTWNCAAWAEIYSAADHSNVLVPLEILFLCLREVSDSGTMLQHLVGNSEMASQKSDISPSHQRPTTCWAWDTSCKPLEPWGSHRNQKASFCLPGAGSCCLSLMFVGMLCPQSSHSALLHTTQELTCTPSLTSVLLSPPHRWTVQKSVQLPVSSENIS